MPLTSVQRLEVYRLGQVCSVGGIGETFRVLQNPVLLRQKAEEASKWVRAAIEVVRCSHDNPFDTDEQIAEAILQEVEKRRGKGRRLDVADV